MTQKGNLSPNSTQALIRRHLQHLVEHGCFVVSKQGATELYRPTLRYQIQVKELAATKLYRQLQSLLSEPFEYNNEPVVTGGADA